VLRALGYEMKRDGVTGTKPDGQQAAREGNAVGRAKKTSIRCYEFGSDDKGGRGYERARARVRSWETA